MKKLFDFNKLKEKRKKIIVHRGILKYYDLIFSDCIIIRWFIWLSKCICLSPPPIIVNIYLRVGS